MKETSLSERKEKIWNRFYNSIISPQELKWELDELYVEAVRRLKDRIMSDYKDGIIGLTEYYRRIKDLDEEFGKELT